MGVEEPSNQLSELAYYYPEPYWLAEESSWVKSLLLFFDGVAILLPDYMDGRELVADPTLAEPLADQGLLKVLHPEWFVDQQLSDRLGEGMVELIVAGAFDDPDAGRTPFAEISMSRMGFAALSSSRMGSIDAGVFQMVLDELKARGLARDSEDGVSIPFAGMSGTPTSCSSLKKPGLQDIATAMTYTPPPMTVQVRPSGTSWNYGRCPRAKTSSSSTS